MVNNSSEEKYVYEGVIANHDSEPFEGQVVINGDSGIIEEITSKGVYKPSKKFDDSCFIFPGMGDVHIHAREDETGDHSHKETYSTAASAAKNGGTVHISAMPNTPSPVTDEERFKWHRDRVKSVSDDISILNYVGIGNGTRPIGKLKEHFYKAYFGKSVGDLTFYDENELENTIKHYFGQKVSFHVEYQPFIDASINGKNHSERRPEGAVNFGLKLLLPLIEKYKLDSKLCHWSTGGMSFEMIEEHRERSKREGFPYTTIEVSPLHLLFDNSMTEKRS